MNLIMDMPQEISAEVTGRHLIWQWRYVFKNDWACASESMP